MRVTLVALNAMYVHTSLAARILHAAVARANPSIEHTIEHTMLELHINQPFEAQLRAIRETVPDVVCFSTYIWNAEQVFRLARTLKAALPGLRIVLGGPQTAGEVSALFAQHPAVDALVCGEGERSYPALLGAFASGRETGVPGVYLRGDGGNVRGAAPHTLPPEEWVDPYAGRCHFEPHRIWYVETSRGCPFRCQFCLSAGEDVRALSAQQAIERLSAMARGGAKLVKLVDRTFNFDAARAREIWRALLALDTACVFHFEVEAHLLTEACLALLAQAPKGRFQFEIGVQSTCAEALGAVGRGDHFAAIARAAHTLGAADNIPLHLDLIAGLPGESFESFARSFDDVYALRPHMLQLGFLKLLPGTGLRQNAQALGIVHAPDPPYQVLRTAQMSIEELDWLHDVEAVLNWYGNTGRYAASMQLLTRQRSPFAVYHTLAQALRRGGAFDAARSERQRIDLLWQWGAKWLEEKREDLADALRFDALCAGQLSDQLPQAIRGDESAQKKLVADEILRAAFAQRSDRRAHTVGDFAIDVVRLRDTGELIRKPCRLLIDQRTGESQTV